MITVRYSVCALGVLIDPLPRFLQPKFASCLFIGKLPDGYHRIGSRPILKLAYCSGDLVAMRRSVIQLNSEEFRGHNTNSGILIFYDAGLRGRPALRITIRVDVPECDGKPAFTKFYGNGAIYSMTPCSEEAARAALKHIRPAPVSVWMPELRALPSPEDD